MPNIVNLTSSSASSLTNDGATIVSYTLDNGGGTFDVRRNELLQPATGYAVGIGVSRRVPLEEFGADAVAKYVFDRDLDVDPNVYLGTWIHDGYVYLDVVVILQNRETAIGLAREWGEQAIYDFSRNTEIPIPTTVRVIAA